jgi:hypothetical protein
MAASRPRNQANCSAWKPYRAAEDPARQVSGDDAQAGRVVLALGMAASINELSDLGGGPGLRVERPGDLQIVESHVQPAGKFQERERHHVLAAGYRHAGLELFIRWLWPAVSAALAVGLGLLAVPHILELEPIDLTSYKFTPFATEPAPESAASWSPDGASIAYLRKTNGVDQVMVRGLDASAPLQLTHGENSVEQVFWAPDASLLYYAMGDALYGISPAGGKSTLIQKEVRTAAISPDGKTLAFWRLSGSGDQRRRSVWISSPPAGTAHEYRPAPFAVEGGRGGDSLQFAPYGASILVSARYSGSRLWLLPFPEGRGASRELFAGTDLGATVTASWLPDSRPAILAFAPGFSLQPALWLADTKREQLRKLTAGTLAEAQPSLAPGGKKMVFTSMEEDYNLWELPVDGSAPRMLLANSRNEMSP